jgi:hypothetical protein
MSEVVHLFPPFVAGRDCEGCGDAHHELGTLCAGCRLQQPTHPDTFVVNATASVIADLELWDRQGHPLAGPLADALKSARKLYDAVGPRVQGATPGEIHYVAGEYWAFPADSNGVQLGPYPSSERADAALVEFAANTPQLKEEDQDPDEAENRWNAENNGGMP